MQDNRFPFPDRQSSWIVFQKDPCLRKIPQDQTQLIFEDAWTIGKEHAKAFLEEHCDPSNYDMSCILSKLGFSVIEQDIDNVVGKVRYFCEYLSEKNTIYVYKKSIMLWAESNCFDYTLSKNIILAHEYFHYLEAHKIGWVSGRCTVPMLRIGKLAFGKTGIASLSEVAANAFANECYNSCRKAVPSDQQGEETESCLSEGENNEYNHDRRRGNDGISNVLSRC